jgi:hypothetical protein
MKVTVKEEKTYDAAILQVCEKDESGENVPFKNGNNWEPTIDIEAGTVIGWPNGTTADIHFKVCDEGTYTLKTSFGAALAEKEGYVPDIMCPGGEGFGDYIIMKIDENGKIENWQPTLSGFDDIEEADEIDNEEAHW